MPTDNAKKLIELLEDTVNSGYGTGDLNDAANAMTRMHRTLIQKFTNVFMLPFIREMAKKYDIGDYDDRDEVACRLCRYLLDCIREKYGIEDISLPFI